MATAPKNKTSQDKAAEDKAKALAREEMERASRKSATDATRIIKSLDTGFSTLHKDIGGVGKIIKSHTDFLERTAKSTGNISRSSAETSARLMTLIKLQREDNKDNVVSLVQSQFDVFDNYFDKSLKKLERIADHSDMTSARLWTLIKDERADNKDNTVSLEDTQYKKIVKINDNISSINKRALMIAQRIWTLQDLMIASNKQMEAMVAQQTKVSQKLLIATAKTHGKISKFLSRPPQPIQLAPNPAGTPNKNSLPTVGWWERWTKDFNKIFDRLTNHITGIFQRGIIGRLLDLNPLIGMVGSIVQDVGQTIADIGGTFWQTYLLFAGFFKKRSALGSGTVSAAPDGTPKPSLLDKFGTALFGAVFAVIRFIDVIKSATGIGGKLRAATGAITESGIWKSAKSMTKGITKKFAWLNAALGLYQGATEDYESLSSKAQGGWKEALQRVTLGITRASADFLGAFIDVFVDVPTWIVGKLFGIDWLTKTNFSQMFSDTVQKGFIGILNFFETDVIGDFKLVAKSLYKDLMNLVPKAIGGIFDMIGMEQTGAFIAQYDLGGKILGALDSMYTKSVAAISMMFTKIDEIFTNMSNSISSWWIDSEMNPKNWDWVDSIKSSVQEASSALMDLLKNIVGWLASLVPEWLRPESLKAAMDKLDTKAYETLSNTAPIGAVPVIPADTTKERQMRNDDERQKQSNGTTVVNNNSVASAPQQQQSYNGNIFSHNTESSFYGMA